MGSPSTKIREILLQVGSKRELSFDEKVELIKERVIKLTPYLRFMPLISFTQVSFLNSAGFTRPILPVYETTCQWALDQGLSRDQQGIYLHTYENCLQGTMTPNPTPKSPLLPLNSHWLVGLDRNGCWFRIEVDFKDGPGYKDRGEQIPTAIFMKYVNAATMLQTPGADFIKIWLLLSKTVDEWVKQRELRLRQAREVSEAVKSEDYLIAPFLVPKMS